MDILTISIAILTIIYKTIHYKYKRRSYMNVIAELTIIPIGVGLSLSKYIAECENVLKNKGLVIQLHAEGTNIEGELDIVIDGIKHCIEAVHKLGAPRIITDIKISSRTDKVQNMDDIVQSVKSKT